MANEGNLFKDLRQIQKRLDNDLHKRIPAFKDDNKYIRFAKQAGINGLYGAQVGLQIFPFTKGMTTLIKTIPDAVRFLKPLIPIATSVIGTGATQYGIEKLNNKTDDQAKDKAINASLLDLASTIGLYNLKNLYIKGLKNTPRSDKVDQAGKELSEKIKKFNKGDIIKKLTKIESEKESKKYLYEYFTNKKQSNFRPKQKIKTQIKSKNYDFLTGLKTLQLHAKEKASIDWEKGTEKMWPYIKTGYEHIPIKYRKLIKNNLDRIDAIE